MRIARCGGQGGRSADAAQAAQPPLCKTAALTILHGPVAPAAWLASFARRQEQLAAPRLGHDVNHALHCEAMMTASDLPDQE